MKRKENSIEFSANRTLNIDVVGKNILNVFGSSCVKLYQSSILSSTYVCSFLFFFIRNNHRDSSKENEQKKAHTLFCWHWTRWCSHWKNVNFSNHIKHISKTTYFFFSTFSCARWCSSTIIIFFVAKLRDLLFILSFNFLSTSYTLWHKQAISE